jgi:uncharacterized protein (TIGR02246 family)
MQNSSEDIEEIRRLTAEYNRAFDESRAEDWANCFTPDGFFERSNAGRSYQGREEIAELCRSYPVAGRHITGEHIIQVDGDTATQTCYLLYLDRNKNFAVDMFGVYNDELVRRDGKWLFKTRLLKVDEG